MYGGYVNMWEKVAFHLRVLRLDRLGIAMESREVASNQADNRSGYLQTKVSSVAVKLTCSG